jgi:hypothetical protein
MKTFSEWAKEQELAENKKQTGTKKWPHKIWHHHAVAARAAKNDEANSKSKYSYDNDEIVCGPFDN